jgi:hypothetical protein
MKLAFAVVLMVVALVSESLAGGVQRSRTVVRQRSAPVVQRQRVVVEKQQVQRVVVQDYYVQPQRVQRVIIEDNGGHCAPQNLQRQRGY